MGDALNLDNLLIYFVTFVFLWMKKGFQVYLVGAKLAREFCHPFSVSLSKGREQGSLLRNESYCGLINNALLANEIRTGRCQYRRSCQLS
jgi:hypothetical protein